MQMGRTLFVFLKVTLRDDSLRRNWRQIQVEWFIIYDSVSPYVLLKIYAIFLSIFFCQPQNTRPSSVLVHCFMSTIYLKFAAYLYRTQSDKPQDDSHRTLPLLRCHPVLVRCSGWLRWLWLRPRRNLWPQQHCSHLSRGSDNQRHHCR